MQTIVELVGLPGSGKSLCESLLAEELRRRGIAVARQARILAEYQRKRLFGMPAPALRRYRIVRAIGHLRYRAVVNCREVRNRIAIGRVPVPLSRAKRLPCQWLAEDMLLTDLFRNDSSTIEVYLNSEGLVHHSAAVAVWLGPSYRGISQPWLDRRGGDDMFVINIRSPLETALQRLWQRGAPHSWPPSAKSNLAAAQSVLVQFQEAIKESIQRFQSAGARVCDLDNSGDKPALSAQVDRLVEDWLGATSAASSRSAPTPVTDGGTG